MQGISRSSLRTALARFEEQAARVPGGLGALEISEGLYAVAGLLDREPSLRRAFTDPASSPPSRRQLADRLLAGQLPTQPLEAFREMVALPWSGPADLRESVEIVAATAALAAAEREDVLDDVEDELFRFSRLLEREPQLRAALTDPALPADRKRTIVQSLLDGRARPTTVRLVTYTVTGRRSRSLEAALDELSRLAAARRQRLVAHVRAAAPLQPAQEQRLAGTLARIYGHEVVLQVEVDPSVLGGVQVRVADEVLDGTVARRLQDVRRELAR